MQILIADDNRVAARARGARPGSAMVDVRQRHRAVDAAGGHGLAQRSRLTGAWRRQLEVCRRVRASAGHYVYIILTARPRRKTSSGHHDAEADDFHAKR